MTDPTDEERKLAAEKRKELLDTTWRIHGAQVDWTGKVDSKASFALAIESALILGIANFSKSDAVLGRITGRYVLWAYYVGIVCVLLALLAAVWVVMPRLRWRHVEEEYPTNFVYFGHLRFWDNKHDQLVALMARADILPVLTSNIARMGKIAWWKHVWLKVSLFLAAVGGCLVAAAGYFNSIGWLTI